MAQITSPAKKLHVPSSFTLKRSITASEGIRQSMPIRLTPKTPIWGGDGRETLQKARWRESALIHSRPYNSADARILDRFRRLGCACLTWVRTG